MEKIRLKDKTEFSISPASSVNQIIILKGELTIDEVKSKMTEDNLSEYEILSEAGNVTGAYKDKEVVSMNMIEPDTDSIIFNLKDVDMIQKRLRLLESDTTSIKTENAELKELVDTLIVNALEV